MTIGGRCHHRGDCGHCIRALRSRSRGHRSWPRRVSRSWSECDLTQLGGAADNRREQTRCRSRLPGQYLFGGVALALFHRQPRFSPNTYFLWLFGAVNLLNGSGYPLYSAILGSGDWAVVVQRTASPRAGLAGWTGRDGAMPRMSVPSCSRPTELARAVENDLVSSSRDSWSRLPGVCRRQHVAGRRVGFQSDRPKSHPVVRREQRIRRDGRTHRHSDAWSRIAWVGVRQEQARFHSSRVGRRRARRGDSVHRRSSDAVYRSRVDES